MTKREKVIRGIEAHANPKTCETCAGEECPYYNMGGGYTGVTCSSILAADALALLKEQEPRVMTLEELQAIETPWNRNTPPYLWMENRTGRDNRWYPVWDIRECVGMIGTRGSQNYGVVWRVWSCRPSQEQMRDTPWEKKEESK